MSLILSALMLVATSLAAVATETVGQSANLNVLDVRFDPVGTGKNSLAVQVQNLTDQPQVFGIHIQTRAKPRGPGWGAQFFEQLAPREEKPCRFAYAFPVSPEADGSVRLRFYNPLSAGQFQFEEYFQELTRSVGELPARTPDSTPARPAPAELSEALIGRFKLIQDLVRSGKYQEVWEAFSQGERQAGFNGSFDWFLESMQEEEPLFSWSRSDFLALVPMRAEVQDDSPVLLAGRADATWRVEFVREDGQWRIDWISGFTPPALRWATWQERLLPTMEKRATAHFDIYYAKGSTAVRDIEQIAERKESGYQEVQRFLGREDSPRIQLVLFEDQQVKLKETGHQGAGWAFGTTIVEVYNDRERLDPFHETTHILAAPIGQPPALFEEGFAVYMSERLGAHALRSLKGGDLAVYERARQLRAEGRWMPLAELLTYTDIGSEQSRPEIAYPEAGAFVKFLVDTYGKDKFLAAFKELRNSEDKDVQQQNAAALERIYGKTLADLESGWLAAIGLEEEAALHNSCHDSFAEGGQVARRYLARVQQSGYLHLVQG